jgi:hypothetical protein
MGLLPETFAVFILTHGRPDNVITLKTLKKCGYTGRLFFIVDDEDKTVDRYIENFGRERVIVFKKKETADACDEGNNFDERRTILMARIACFEIAPTVGVTHFVMLDDDYKQFKFRFENKLGFEAVVKDINRLFASFLAFYKATPALSIALSQGGDHIGGFSITRLKRKCMNSFFCSTERPFKFIGAMNEDVNTYTTLGSRGGLFFTFTSAQLDQKESQQQSGGITEMYLRFGTFCKAFTTVMMMPGSTKVSMLNTSNPRIHHSIDWKATVPCIIREAHQNGGAMEGVK